MADLKDIPLPQREGRSVARERQQRNQSRSNRTPISKGLLVNLGDNIQDAIDSLVPNGGGVITLVAGTHKIDYDIVIPSFITLQGEGRSATIMDFQNQPHNVVLEGAAGAGVANAPEHVRGVRIRDLTMQRSTHPAVLDVSYADYFVLDNVRFSANASTGVWLHACQEYIVINCLADNNANFGFLLSGESDYAHAAFRFINCMATDNGWSNYAITTAANGLVINGAFIGCEADGAGEYGFVLSGTLEVAIKFSGCISNNNTLSGFWADASYVAFNGCQADDNTEYGFLISGIACAVNSCNATTNGLKDYSFTQRVAFVGNVFSYGTTTVPSDLTDYIDVAVNAQGNVGGNTITEKMIYQMKNTSGWTVTAGSPVVLKAVADGDEITSTDVRGNQMVIGMALFDIANNAYGAILVEGYTQKLVVNGTDDIAIGDYLATYSADGIAAKARPNDMAFAIALEAYTADDSLGVINALLIKPRRAGASAIYALGQNATGESLGAAYDDISNFEATGTFTAGRDVLIIASCEFVHTIVSSSAGGKLKLRDATANTDLRTFEIGVAVSTVGGHFATVFKYTIPSTVSRRFVVQGINDDAGNTLTIKNVALFVVELTANLT